MIHSYPKIYLEKARTNLGRMLDFATYDLNYDPNEFFDLFITSGLAKRFEKGDFTLIAGMSGVELAYRVLELTKHSIKDPDPTYTVDRSRTPCKACQIFGFSVRVLPQGRRSDLVCLRPRCQLQRRTGKSRAICG